MWQPTASIASTFVMPLGHQDGIAYIPRTTNDINGILIENTDYGVKNPDLSKSTTCFSPDIPLRDAFHAGEDLYKPDRMTDTAGAEVFAVADGTVIEVTPDIWPGRGIVIEHTLISGQKVYSVYVHLASASVAYGDSVTAGLKIGEVLHSEYDGLYPEYHRDGLASLILDPNIPTVPDSHLHFEIRYFPDADVIYGEVGLFDCIRGNKAGRGYTPPDIHPDNFPSPGAGIPIQQISSTVILPSLPPHQLFLPLKM